MTRRRGPRKAVAMQCAGLKHMAGREDGLPQTGSLACPRDRGYIQISVVVSRVTGRRGHSHRLHTAEPGDAEPLSPRSWRPKNERDPNAAAAPGRRLELPGESLV